MPKLEGHERVTGTNRNEQDWTNQIILVADCSGDTASRHCAWYKSGTVWEHITSPNPTHPFPYRK